MNSETNDVRSVTWADLPAVTRMTFESMTGVDRYFTKMVRRPLGRWLTYVALPLYLRFSGRGFKVLLDGQLAACGFLDMRRHSGYIFNINVSQPFRRQGIGRHLMTYLEGVIVQQGRGWAALQVDHGNVPAEQLYQQLGYQAYHPHFLRREGRLPAGKADTAGVSIQRLGSFPGGQLYKHYQNIERRKGDFWAASVVDEYDSWSGQRGEYWRCRLYEQEAGCAQVIERNGQPLIRLCLSPDYWGDPAIGGVAQELVDAFPGHPTRIDLFLESAAHHQAAMPVLSDLGFRERSDARILMLKALPSDRGASSA